MGDPSSMIMIPSENFNLECPKVVYTDVSMIPELTVSNLQAEISTLRLKQRSLDGRRREALNKVLDIKGSIRVFCRVRSSPSTDRKTSESPISIEEDKITVKTSGGAKKEFGADRVFSQGATQDDVFQEVEPILRSALDGHNVCVFAYGQTGTGKTFTMEGKNENPGIVPRSIEELFHRASQDKSASYYFSMSMLEIYMGSIRDLLTLKHNSSRYLQSSQKCGLNIQSGSNGSIEIEGLMDVAVSDIKQAYRLYTKGKRARSTSWTNVNDASSRSHCLTRITIRRSGCRQGVSKLWMVDLGGSERLLKTGATGQTLDEGKAINLSLLALGDVISSLKKKRNHIPYRNSKLTQILSDSLGDGSKVLMVVHISPSENDTGETMCSLSFARRVRAIEHNKELSEESNKQKEKLIAELDLQIQDTEVDLQKVRNQIERAEQLIQEKNQQKGSPRSPLITAQGEASDTPTEKNSSKACISSVPRFMAPTVSSRQRLSANEQTSARTRTLRFGTRSHVDIISSQSLSYSDTFTKPSTTRSKSKLVMCDSNSPKSSVSRNKKVSTSHPNLRAALSQHRRRMSDVI